MRRIYIKGKQVVEIYLDQEGWGCRGAIRLKGYRYLKYLREKIEEKGFRKKA